MRTNNKKRNNELDLWLSADPNRGEGYAQWQKSFKWPSVRRILAKLKSGGADADRVQRLLFVAPLLSTKSFKFRTELKKFDRRLTSAQDHLRDAINLLKPVPAERRSMQLAMLEAIYGQITAELSRHSEFRKTSNVRVTDWLISWLARELNKVGLKEINKDIATLLNAAEVPGGGLGEDGWSPEAVKKRRDRFALNPLAISRWPTLVGRLQPGGTKPLGNGSETV
jgi:hypothetical protein